MYLMEYDINGERKRKQDYGEEEVGVRKQKKKERTKEHRNNSNTNSERGKKMTKRQEVRSKKGRGPFTCSCCCRASSICCLCFSICEAASFFCSSWAARSCSRRLISWPIIVESWCSFSARLSGVPAQATPWWGGG